MMSAEASDVKEKSFCKGWKSKDELRKCSFWGRCVPNPPSQVVFALSKKTMKPEQQLEML